jgi:signal transduction histidine kinase
VRWDDLGAVLADEALVHQLLANLVGNALKYHHPGQQPSVTVWATPDDAGRVVVRVADRGVGIPDGAEEWIFEPFRRAHAGEFPGTGLGLSSCRRIVERHGGTIRAYPRPVGGGSVFELDLPAPTERPRSRRLIPQETETCPI